ncbi:N-terminal nucleophile aminohydrolase [Auricularia subglabra TFB-10046 SS5]|nr:N-terminal nucleophile aminohydrolase [Auricularia subglabra TFB-10046 SS5]
MPNAVIAVHGGAGDHPEEDERAVRRALRSACKRALEAAHSPLDAAEAAITVLEDDAVLNAGFGSNLTEDGTVECDAALMCADGSAFGSVGAVAGAKNPIKLARRVLDASRVPGALGRVPPMTLVADGARRLALPGERVEPADMVAPSARNLWETWRARVEQANAMQDTVGAVAGGILLKLPGRLGEAAVYGAGCWATADVACSVSGTGEDIVRCALARTIAETIVARGTEEAHDALHDVLTKSFSEPCFARGETEPSAGVLVLVREESAVRLWCAFTTASMAIAYASTAHPKPKARICVSC